MFTIWPKTKLAPFIPVPEEIIKNKIISVLQGKGWVHSQDLRNRVLYLRTTHHSDRATRVLRQLISEGLIEERKLQGKTRTAREYRIVI